MRAVKSGQPIKVRNPNSIRPYQHVLEPLSAYLLIAKKQYEDLSYQGYYNVGPDDRDCITTGKLVEMFCRFWGDGAFWENISEGNAPYEANFLKLDCTKLKSTFGWSPSWNMEDAIKKVCEFYRVWLSLGDIPCEMNKEIYVFFK